MRSKSLAATVTAAMALGCAAPAHADEAQMEAQVRDLVAQVQALRDEVGQLRAAQVQPQVVALPAPSGSADMGTTTAAARETSPLTFTGYGEAIYTRPSEGPEDAIADLTRVVLGVGYRFDDKTRLEVEAEWEHAITSADEILGEAAIEQAYVSREIGDSMQLQAGLFLIPMGIINERHEPPTFFGVFRPLTETAIIPSTWREGGLALLGNTDGGFGWGLGVTTGFNLANWDPTSIDGQESPLGSVHQEMSFADNDLSVFGSVRYTGVPGLALGAAVFTGGAGQDQKNFPANDSHATLWSAYARWAPGDWQLTALYAEGYLTDTANLNLTYIGNPTLVPERFWGGYGQVAYRGWSVRSLQFEPFARYELVNTGAEYANIGQGLTPKPLETEYVTTLGASLYLNPNVVFKLDYQFYNSANAALGYEDRLNLGVGYMY